jgi:hypothetical protein
MTETAQEAPQVPKPTRSIWEDFVDIYVSPREVFERRADGRFGLALLVLTVVLALLAVPAQVVMAPALEAQMQRALAEMGQAAQESPGLFDPTGGLAMFFGVAGTLISTPIAAFVIGFIVWGASRVFDATFPMAVAVMIATYAAFPRVLQTVATIVQGQFIETRSLYGLSLGPARFLDAEAASPALISALGRLDLFTIWGAVLVAIGLVVAGRMRRGQAVVVAVITWLAAMLPALVGPLFAGFMG